MTGGASCPDGIIQQVISRINSFYPADALRDIEAVLLRPLRVAGRSPSEPDGHAALDALLAPEIERRAVIEGVAVRVRAARQRLLVAAPPL